MLRNSSPLNSASFAPFDDIPSARSRTGELFTVDSPFEFGASDNAPSDRGAANRRSGITLRDTSDQLVQVLPASGVKRHLMARRGMAAEFIQATSRDRVEHRFHAPRHLLVAFEQGMRREGETFVEGLPRSTRRDLTRKLTFVPAGHEYHEWHEPRIPIRLMYFYFDPRELEIQSALGISSAPLSPRLFFEDLALWDTVFKMRSLVENPTSENRPYFEALSIVLVHELVRLDRGTDRIEPRILAEVLPHGSNGLSLHI